MSVVSSARACSSTTTLSIAAFLPRRRWPAGVLPAGQGGRYAAFSCEGHIHCDQVPTIAREVPPGALSLPAPGRPTGRLPSARSTSAGGWVTLGDVAGD